MGRPSTYSETLADSILDKLASGDSLRAICAEEGMPDRDTVRRWLKEHDDFAAKYAHAREEQAEFHHEEMDRLESAVEDGSLNPQAASVILANKRWRMEKLKPKVYGPAVTLKGDPANPLQTRVAMTEAELEAIAAAGRANG
ncbi:terminase small subunit-like protein [Lysobacter olei]